MPYYDQITQGIGLIGGLHIGSTGVDLVGYKSGTAAINPGNIGAAASLEVAVAIPGVSVGDEVLFEPPAALETALVPYAVGRVSAADTVQLRLTNVSGAGVDGAERTWRYFWRDLTP